MSTMIVSRLNIQLDLSLPLNTSHTYVDLVQLTKAILSNLGMDGPSSKPRPSKVTSNSQAKEDVVIVGQAFRLPGDINTPESFWTALVEKRQDIIVPVPASRWDHASFYRAPDSKEPPAPCDVTLEKAGFIDIEKFDHSFFGMTSAEAFHVPPSYRLSMEVAFEALENANIPAAKIKGSKMGVFVAAAMDEGYIKLLFADKGWAGMISYAFTSLLVTYFIHSQLIPDSGELASLQVPFVDV